MPGTRRQALNDGTARLTASGALDARLDAEWLLADATGLPRLELLLDADAPLAEHEAARFAAAIARREAGEPLQYVVGEAAFMGRLFAVDSRVLIPRADTEALCEAAVRRVVAREPGCRVLDIGVGSGALAVSLALDCPDAVVTGVDISDEALAVARANSQRLGARVEWLRSDLFSALVDRSFDVIVSNPPYVRSGDMPLLQREVRREPALALDGGADGLHFYRAIVAGLPHCLAYGGALLFEVGDDEASDVAQMLTGAFDAVSTERDLRGVQRVVIGEGYNIQRFK